MRGGFFVGLTLTGLPLAGAAVAVSLAGLSFAGAAIAAPPSDVTPKPAAIVGGEASEVCAWPSVVALNAGGLCSGTLVHPRVVVYAAHCGTFHSKVMFGESADVPAREVETLVCERNSDLFAVSSMDYAYCMLAEPVEDIAITPPLFGCDEALIEVGTPVSIVGFGDTTSEGPAQVGIKHEAQTQIVSTLSLIGIGGMGTGADSGDSGGPAFVELDDGSWRMLGIVSGGGGDGAIVQYVPAPVTIAWIEERSGVDITPCHASDGSWAPTPACEGFHVATGADAQWAQGCPGVRSGPSEACGAPWTELEDGTSPGVAFVDPLDGDLLPSSPIQFTVLAEASDEGVGVAQVRLSVDGAPWLDDFGLATADEVPPYRFEPVLLDQDGEHLLELEAVDYFGNSAYASAVLTVGHSGDGDTGDETGDDSETDSDSETGAPPDEPKPTSTCQCSSDRSASAGLPLLVGLGSLSWIWFVRIRRPQRTSISTRSSRAEPPPPPTTNTLR